MNREYLKDFSEIYVFQVYKLFGTLRDVKRFLNGLRSTLPAIKNEVNISDFLILEILRIFFHEIYRDIWLYPWFYIPTSWSEKTKLRSPYYQYEILGHVSKNPKYEISKEHIESLIKGYKENGEIIRSLLEKLFFVEIPIVFGKASSSEGFDIVDCRIKKRITHPECFEKYFTLSVLEELISDEYMESTLQSWKVSTSAAEDIENLMFNVLQKENRLLQFINKLILFRGLITKEIGNSTMDVILKNVTRFSREQHGLIGFNSEYERAKDLLLFIINEHVDKEKMQDFLIEIIKNVAYLPFAVLIVLYCRRERGSLTDIYESIDLESLQYETSVRLKEHFVDGKRNIFEEIENDDDISFVIYQWGTNWMTFKGKNHEIVHSYVLDIVNEDPKKFAKFLRFQKKYVGGGTYKIPLNEFTRIYDIEDYKDLAIKFKDHEDLSQEEKHIISEFLEEANRGLEQISDSP